MGRWVVAGTGTSCPWTRRYLIGTLGVLVAPRNAGPALLLPVNPHLVLGTQAEQMRMYGADPALGQALIQGLSDIFRVVAFDAMQAAQVLPILRSCLPI